MKKDNNLSIKKPQQMLLSTLEETTLGVWICMVKLSSTFQMQKMMFHLR
ncbi:hypothetical protein [Flavobacterium tegetincola]|nr:hypothetical protein [Flavobacterium tegetincola]